MYVSWLLCAQKPGVGCHGRSRMTATAMIDWCEKLHHAENLSSFSHSAFRTSTAATHHISMMYQISGHQEVTNSVWRLPQQWLRSQPPWLVGACSLANLPSKNTHTITTTQLHLPTRRNRNGQQQPPWCPTSGTSAYNSCPECWLIVVCGGAGSEALWQPWDDGGHHGR